MSLHRNPTYNNDTMHGYMRSQGLATDSPSEVADGFRLGWVAAMDWMTAQKVATTIHTTPPTDTPIEGD